MIELTAAAKKAKAAKAKGTRGEREIVTVLGMVVTRVFERFRLPVPEIKRSDRGCDIEGLVDYAFEVKRDSHPRIQNNCASWVQVETYAQKHGRIPILFYRANGARWRVKIQTALVVPLSAAQGPVAIVDLDVDSFLLWFDSDLAARIEKKFHDLKRSFQ